MSLFNQMLEEVEQDTHQKRDRKVDKMLSDVLAIFPEEDREQVLRDTVRDLNQERKNKFEICPECGKHLLETKWHRGQRRCRNCNHVVRNDGMISVLEFMESHKGIDITIGDIVLATALNADNVSQYLRDLGYLIA